MGDAVNGNWSPISGEDSSAPRTAARIAVGGPGTGVRLSDRAAERVDRSAALRGELVEDDRGVESDLRAVTRLPRTGALTRTGER